MTPRGLHDSFKRDVADYATPSLWSDEEIYEYMNWSLDQFCIGWGGIVDSSSALTTLKAMPDQEFVKISPRILKIKTAYSTTKNRRVKILNQQDVMAGYCVDDYGFEFRNIYESRPGPVRGIIIDMGAGKGRWVDIPTEDEMIKLVVERLPLCEISCQGAGDIELGDEFLRTILLGMKSQAYDKQDAESFDKSKAEKFLDLFNLYVRQARSVREARESKVRTVAFSCP